MDRLIKRIKTYPVIGLDTSLFIYHFEKHADYLPLTRALFSAIEAGNHVGVTSTITLMEILVRPFQLGRQDIARKYEALLVNFPHLEIVDLDRGIIRHAAHLRAEYHLRPPDALQVSACLAHSAQALITDDRHLERIKGHLDVIFLDDFVRNRARS